MVKEASRRIPAADMAAAGLPDDLCEVGGQTVIDPPCDDDLAALIGAITPENRHGEVDLGPAVGGEAY